MDWSERITMLSIHPDAATRDDVAQLAAELMEANAEIERLRGKLDIITKALVRHNHRDILEQVLAELKELEATNDPH